MTRKIKQLHNNTQIIFQTHQLIQPTCGFFIIQRTNTFDKPESPLLNTESTNIFDTSITIAADPRSQKVVMGKYPYYKDQRNSLCIKIGKMQTCFTLETLHLLILTSKWFKTRFE